MAKKPAPEAPPARLLIGTPYCGTCAHRVGPEVCRYFGRAGGKDKAFEAIRLGVKTCMFWRKEL